MIRCAASPNTAGTPRARRLLTTSGSVSITTYGTPKVSSASPMALPTRPKQHRTTWPESAFPERKPHTGAGAWARRARPIQRGTNRTSAALSRIGPDVARLPRHLDQDEGEFADLGEPDAHEERGP